MLISMPGAMNDALTRLDAVKARAVCAKHPLSGQAAGLHKLRAELDLFLVTGQLLAVNPYQFAIGNKPQFETHLAAPNALKRLADKLVDGLDDQRPTGNKEVIAVLVTAKSVSEFATALAAFAQVVPVPEICQAARRAKNLIGHEDNKLILTKPAMTPKWKGGNKLHLAPIEPTQKLLGAQIAQIEAIAADSDHPVAHLRALATKRNERIAGLKASLDSLKASINGTCWAVKHTGDVATIAELLKQETAPSFDYTYTAGFCLVASPGGLKYFSEMLGL